MFALINRGKLIGLAILIPTLVLSQINLDEVRSDLEKKAESFQNADLSGKIELSKDLAFSYFYTDIDNSGFIHWAETYIELCKSQKDIECELFGYLHFLPNYSFYDDSIYQERMVNAQLLYESTDNQLLGLALAISNAQYAAFIDGDFKNSLDILGEAQFINDQIDDNELTPYLYYLISSVYKYSGQAEKAIAYSDKIFQLEEPKNIDLARAHLSKGIAQLEAERLDSLEYHLIEASKLYDGLNNTYSLITIYNTLGKYYLNTSRPEDALVSFSKVEPIIQQVEYSFGSPLYDCYYHIGESYEALNQLDSAAVFYEKCILQAKKEKDLDALILYRTDKAYLSLSTLNEETGNYQKALEHYRTYKSYSDTLAKYTRNQVIEELSIKYATREKEQQISLLNKETELLSQRTFIISLSVGSIALISLLSFFNSRRKNKIITEKNKELEEINEVKDRFFAIIGHDLREPAEVFNDLTLVVKYLLEKKDFDSIEKLGTQIEASGYSLKKIINNLLNWALTQRDILPYHPEQVSIHEVISELKEVLVYRAKEKNIEINYGQIKDEKVWCDKNALFTVMLNLLDNAIKYSPENGSITISTANSDKMKEISVKDEGKGMNKKQLEALFSLSKDKSQRGTKGEKGVGLGLHIAYEIVKMNKGTLTVESEIEGGSTFRIGLPAEKA